MTLIRLNAQRMKWKYWFIVDLHVDYHIFNMKLYKQLNQEAYGSKF